MTNNGKYLFIYISGKTKSILFEKESKTEMESACTFNLKNRNYIIGGLYNQKQVEYNS